MCRNITELRGLEPAATAEEIEAAARQYVRKVSGVTRPTAANVEAFETAVAEVTATTTRLLAALPPRTQPPKTVPPLRRPEVRARIEARAAAPGDRATLTQPALKEWSAAVHAMLDGRQTVLLRKGGIHEKRFDARLAALPVLPDGRPQPRAAGAARASRPARGRGRRQHRGEIVLRAGAKVVAAVEVNRPEGLDEIAPLHIWTAESVRADRLDFRPKHRLTVLVVQVSPLAEPVRLRRHARIRGLHELGAAAGRPDVGDAGARRRDAARDRRPRARSVGLTAARPAGSTQPRRAVAEVHGVRGRRAAGCPVISGSPVPRLRANRGCDPPATSTRMRDPPRNRCATASSSMRTVPESRCAAAISVADIAGPALARRPR